MTAMGNSNNNKATAESGWALLKQSTGSSSQQVNGNGNVRAMKAMGNCDHGNTHDACFALLQPPQTWHGWVGADLCAAVFSTAFSPWLSDCTWAETPILQNHLHMCITMDNHDKSR